MKPLRAISVAVFSAQLALGHIASVGTPAQASLTCGLRKGENRYLEVSLEPGTHVLFVETEGDASFLLYENNGRLIGKSRRFASDPKDTSGAELKVICRRTTLPLDRRKTMGFEARSKD